MARHRDTYPTKFTETFCRKQKEKRLQHLKESNFFSNIAKRMRTFKNLLNCYNLYKVLSVFLAGLKKSPMTLVETKDEQQQ